MLRSLSVFVLPLILSIVTISPLESAATKASSALRIHSLAELPTAQPEGTVYYFDIDDTLIDSPHMLGTKAWRKYISSATKGHSGLNLHDYFSLYLAKYHPITTVEPITTSCIRDLQLKGYAVYGLTARERNKWYDTPVDDIDALTILQLESAGVDLNFVSPVHAYPKPILNDTYYRGVYFSDLDLKGDYLLRLYANVCQKPVKVIFVDDKLHHVESVAKALDSMGIEHECYWYAATEVKDAAFDPLIANIQLYHFCLSNAGHALTDEEAAAEGNGTKTAEDYLQLILELFQNGASSPVTVLEQQSP